ncbi:MAG TPA: flagellar assembly protein FliH [Caulobacteraceae bacterium]|nr:flagellar assembly protein FliH [Caulobacteraceae bacterium]
MTQTHRKFTFDTVFDGDGEVASAPALAKRFFAVDEVERIRERAFEEGQRSVVARAEETKAQALTAIAGAAQAALGALAHVAHEHTTACAELALASARTIAGEALERFPTVAAEAALVALAREVEAAPKLTVRAAPDLVSDLQAALDETGRAIGFAGQIVVKDDPSLPLAAFVLDWGDGRADFDPDAAAARVAEALRTALAAEGLHAEPLIPRSETDHG